MGLSVVIVILVGTALLAVGCYINKNYCFEEEGDFEIDLKAKQ